MKKLFRGSALVYTMIMMMLLLVSALALATTTLIQQRGSLALGDSVKAFQLANDGFEDITAKYTKGNASQLNGVGSCSNGVVTNDIVTGKYTATFKDREGNAISSCEEFLSNVSEVKVVATNGASTRAIETAFGAGAIGQYQISCGPDPSATTDSDSDLAIKGVFCIRLNTSTGETQCVNLDVDRRSGAGAAGWGWQDCPAGDPFPSNAWSARGSW